MKPLLLVLAPAYRPRLGGVETHLARVHRELADELDIEVFVRHDARPERIVRHEGVRVRSLAPGPPAVWGAWLAARHPGLLRRAAAIHSHDVFSAALRRLVPRTRWVHTFHGYEGWPLREEAVAARRRVAAAVDHRIAVGAYIEQWYGTPCDDVVYGAVDCPPGEPRPAPEWDAVFFGRLEADTGLEAYLRGWALLGDPRLRLLVVGDGRLAGWARGFAAEHALTVELRPATSGVLDLARRARVAFVSGYLAIAEAACLGLPVVAFHGTPIKESYLRCHPAAEYLHIAGSPAEIAAAFRVARDQDAAALQAWAREQTWARLAGVYRRAYGLEPSAAAACSAARSRRSSQRRTRG